MEWFQQTFPALVLGDDGVGRRGPGEGLWVGVVGVEVGADGLVQLDDGAEDAALQPLLGQGGEEALDGVDPGGRGWREVHVDARMPGQPSLHSLGLVGGVVVEDQVQVEPGRGLLIDQAEEADELAARWRSVHWLITVPAFTSRAANSVVVPWRL